VAQAAQQGQRSPELFHGFVVITQLGQDDPQFFVGLALQWQFPGLPGQRDAVLQVRHSLLVRAQCTVRDSEVSDRADFAALVSGFPVKHEGFLAVLNGQVQFALAGEDLTEHGMQISMLGPVAERGVDVLCALEASQRLLVATQMEVGPGSPVTSASR
jgi:hypothetical protein